jgi:hypothetical protein
MGTHRPEGIFLAAGQGIQQNLGTPQLSILDIAPLVLYSVGLPIPSDLEGQLPVGIFEKSLVQTAPALKGATTIPPDGSGTGPEVSTLDAEGEAQVMERLKVLGYLE